jgi:hypothetical protein
MFLSSLESFAQISPTDKHIMDSLLQNDEMLKMINNLGKASSYIRVDVGIGNKLYSSQDKQVITLQNNADIVFTPSIGYFHKSGFGISFTGFLLSENKKTAFYQFSLSPSFYYTKSKIIDGSISYTHYFERDEYGSNTSPVQDEFYGTLLFKKPWLKPGIAAGYSYGNINQVIKIDTTIKVLNREILIKYIDTARIQLSSFSLAANVEHSFTFFNLFSIKDGLVFTPQLSLMAGLNKYQVHHSSSLENYNSFTKKKIKRLRHFLSQSDNDKFELQSAGMDLFANYSIGKFYLQPEIYFDYFLPETSDNRFTQIYSLNIGITF